MKVKLAQGTYLQNIVIIVLLYTSEFIILIYEK